LVGCESGETVSVQGANSPFNYSTGLIPMRWDNSSLPLNVKTSTDITADFVAGDYDGNGHDPVEQMEKEWEDANTAKTFFTLPANTTNNLDTGNLDDFNDGTFGIYKSTNWFSNVSSSALAITQFYAIRKNSGFDDEYYKMIHVDIIMNYRDYTFSLDANSTNDYDFHTVLLHELGHLLGLDHQANGSIDAVMQPYLSVWESKRSLYANDKSRLVDNYAASSLTARALTQGSASMKTAANEGETIRGVIELRADGQCIHYINDKMVHVHSKN
jgi:hypothetical protein